MNRQEIKDKIQVLEDSIKDLQNQILFLQRENAILCDGQQWYTEETEEHLVSIKDGSKKKVKEKILIGRIKWNQNFVCSDAGDTVAVERSRIVRMHGEWVGSLAD